MVRQARERKLMQTILNIAVDQLHHLAGQEPSLTSLVAAGDDRRSIFGQIPHMPKPVGSKCSLFLNSANSHIP